MKNWRGALQSKAMRNVVIGIFVTDAIGAFALQMRSDQLPLEAFDADTPAVAAAADTIDPGPPHLPAPAVTRRTEAKLAVSRLPMAPAAVTFAPIDLSTKADEANADGVRQATADQQQPATAKVALASDHVAPERRALSARTFANQFANTRVGAVAAKPARRTPLNAGAFAEAFASIRASEAGPSPELAAPAATGDQERFTVTLTSLKALPEPEGTAQLPASASPKPASDGAAQELPALDEGVQGAAGGQASPAGGLPG